MAGFYACLKTQDEPTMAESLSEASGSLEVLEASDEGKKKSKFKAFKNFFGKKKKKEPQDAQGGRRLKASLSSGSIDISSLKPVLEGRRLEARAKSSMGSKALSHDSIFMLDTEPEISARRIYPSPEPQRGRPLQLPSLRPRRSSNSPPLIRSDTISDGFEEISVDEESPKTPKKKTSPPKIVTLKKSSFQPSPGHIRSQSLTTFALIASPGSIHLPMSFNTAATTKDCLDSSAARHKMALNPRKQKKIKNPQTTGKAKQEEPILLVVSGEEKSTTKPKEADQKKPKKDGAGVSSLTQSKRSELDKKTAEQAARADAAGSQSYPLPAGHGRRRTKKGSGASASSECAPRGRSFQQPGGGPGLGDRAGSPPAEKTARDCLPWPLPPEPHVAEQPPAPQAARAPRQELLADADGMAKRKAGADLKARKGPVAPPAPEDAADATVRGPAPRGGDGACGAEPPEAGAAGPPAPESLATTQDDVILSVAMEAQVLMDPSQIQSEGEEAFSFDLQALKFKMESVQDIPAVCRERAPGNILRAFTASIAAPASALADGGLSAERLTPRSLSWALAKPAADDPESASEESGSERPLLPGQSVRGPRAPGAPQQAFTESETSAAELSDPEQPRLPSRYSPRAFGRPAAGEASSDPESGSEESGSEESGSEEVSGSERPPAPRRAFQPLGKSDDDDDDDQEASASATAGDSSGSSERLTPRCVAPALDEPEDPVSTESASYVEQYSSADDWSSAEEHAPTGAPGRASGKPTDPRQGASRSENLPEEWAVSVERLAQAFSRPRLQQQPSSGAARPPAPRSSPVEPAPAWPPVPSPWLSPQAAQHAAAGPPSGSASAAADWASAPEPLPPRIPSKHLGRPRAEQPGCKGAEPASGVRFSSAELPPPPPPPRSHSQPPREPVAERAVRADPECPAVEGSISVQLPPPRRPSQAVVRPVAEQHVCLGAEGAVVEKSVSVPLPPLPRYHAQPLTQLPAPRQAPAGPESPAASAEPLPPKGPAAASVDPKGEPNVFTGLEGAAAEKAVSAEPLLPRSSSPSSTNPKAQHVFELAVKEGPPVEPQPRGPSQPLVRPKVRPQPGPLDSVGASASASGGHPALAPALGLALSPALVPGPASPRSVYQSWLSPSFEQQGSVSAESVALEWGISLEPLPPLPPLPPRKPSQNPRKRGAQQAASRRSASAPPERSAPAQPKPPRCAFQSRVSTKLKQPVSEALEGSEAQKIIAMEQHSSRKASQALTRALVMQPASTAPEGFVAQRSVAMEQPSPRMPSQTLTKAAVEQPASEAPEGSVAQKSMAVEQPSSRMPSQTLTKASVKQPAPVVPEGSVAQRIVAIEQPSPRMPSQTLTKASVKQPASGAPEGSVAQRIVAIEQPSPRMPSQTLTKASVKQPASGAPEGSVAQRIMAIEQPSPKRPSQTLTKATVKQPASGAPEGSVAQRSVAMEQPSPRMPSQTLTKASVKQPVPVVPEGSVAQRIVAIEQPSPKRRSQTLTKATVKQPASKAPEGSVAQRSVAMEQPSPRMPSQTLTKASVKQPAPVVPEGSVAQRIVAIEQPSPRRPSQTLTKAAVKQPASKAPGRVATEEGASRKPLPSGQSPPSPGRYKVQQMSSSFESAATEAAMSGKPVPSKHPSPLSSRSKVQEISSRLENAAAEAGSAKKPPAPRHPSQSFVKFMAEQVFSESPAGPLAAKPSSKSLRRSKVQYPQFWGPENASTQGRISQPTACPPQPSGRPEGPREVPPRSESAPTKLKQSSSKEPLPPQQLAKPVSSSVSQHSPEIRKSLEKQLPSRGPPQAKAGAPAQPRLFSPGPAAAGVPVEWSRSEERRPRHRRHPRQALADLEYPPQARSSSGSAAAEAAVSESRPSTQSLPRGPASPNKTRKHRQGLEELPKNTLPPATKPVKSTTAPARQASTSGGTKKEGLESGDRNNSHANVSTGRAGVETLFGVRLRKVPSLSKYKSEKYDDLTKLSSLFVGPVSSSTGKEQHIRGSISQGLLGAAEKPTTASDVAEKQQSRPKSESVAKRQSIFKAPGKPVGRQSDYATSASEPAWITMVKQRQKGSQANIPKKEANTKNKAGVKAEIKEPRHGAEPSTAHKTTLQKGIGLASENQPRKTFTSDVDKLVKTAQRKLPKSTKTGFEDPKIGQLPATAKETRRSSTLPAVFREPAEPEEPVWFSLAKEKAKAWSHIAEIMQ